MFLWRLVLPIDISAVLRTQTYAKDRVHKMRVT